MKRTILLIILILTGSLIIYSQVPQAMTYKAIAKDNWGVSLPCKAITLRFTILKGSEFGLPVYIEVHSTVTNKFGLMDVQIGKGIPKLGNFADIDWSTGSYYIKIEMDPKGGSDFRLEDPAHQLLSVPYALFAGSSGNSFSGNYNDLYNKPTNLSQFNNDAGFLRNENDPIFFTHPAHGITNGNLVNWNTAFSWGNHAGLYKPLNYVPAWSEVTGKPFSITLPEAGQLLKFNYISGKWENWTPNYLTAEVDGSITNEIQTLNLSANELTISGTGGNTVTFTNWDTDITNDVTTTGDQIIAGNKTFTGTIKVPTPVNATDAATKAYVDAMKQEIKLEIYTEMGVTDIDGNHYNAIKIGNQVWMAENLKTTRYRNGDLIGTTTPATLNISSESTPKYQWAYDDNESSVATYGRLYTWYVATDNRNVCPDFWHVPTDAELTILTDYLTNNGYGYEGSGSDIAKSLAARSGWATNATAGNIGNDQASNNSSGFTALPGGYRISVGTFIRLGDFTGWWSSTEFTTIDAWYRSLDSNINYMIRSYDNKKDAGPIRCVRN